MSSKTLATFALQKMFLLSSLNLAWFRLTLIKFTGLDPWSILNNSESLEYAMINRVLFNKLATLIGFVKNKAIFFFFFLQWIGLHDLLHLKQVCRCSYEMGFH